MLGKIFAAMGTVSIMTTAISAEPPPSRPPIYIVAERAGRGIRVTVLGSSDTAIEARYSLEVSSDAGSGRNRAVQSGSVRLPPGVTMTLVNLALGDVSRGKWTARLSVEPRNGTPYEQVKGLTDIEGRDRR